MSSRIVSGVLVLSALLSNGCADDGKNEQSEPGALASVSPRADDPEADPEYDPEYDPEADQEADQEDVSESNPESDPESDSESDPEYGVAPEADPESDPEVAPEADPEPDPEVAPEAEPQPEPGVASADTSGATPQPANAAAIEGASGKCTEAEGNAILEAYYWANAAVADAIEKTPTNDPVRWATWFTADPTQSAQDHVRSTLTDIKDRTLGSEFRCLKNPGTADFERCNQINVLAFVNLRKPFINLCPRFFETTTEWRINSLVHEAAHLSLDEGDFKPKSDPSPNNSVAQAIALAQEDLYFALRNASNFAHFVTNDPSM